MADFRLMSGIPLYFAFLFGFIRDLWHPFGLRDRGYMIFFGSLGAALSLAFLFAPVSQAALLAASLVLTCASLFAAAAQNGLSATIARQHAMTGRVAAVWSIFAMIPWVSALLLGGHVSEALEGSDPLVAQRILLRASAALLSAVALFALWRPRAVYENVHHEDPDRRRPWRELGRLLRHKPALLALLIWMMWNFNPGAGTPAQYHLQNTLGASDSDWGHWSAIYWGSFVPTFMLYGLLCRRYPLRRLLRLATVIAIPQFTPLLAVHSVSDAMVAAVAIGLMGGLANAAFLELLIRSCPPGLQGTVLMASTSVYYLASRFADVLGAGLYERAGGFSTCVAATVLVYALILPVLLFIPREITEQADGILAPVRRD
jgi:MFS family permease